MNRMRESISVKYITDDAEENWQLLFRHLRRKMKLDEIVQILERDQIVFKPGQMFTKDLTNCKNPGEFRLKKDTIMKNQGMFWNILEKRTPDLLKQSIKSLENFLPEIDLKDYGTTFKAKNDILELKLEGLKKICLLPVLPLPTGGYFDKNLMEVRYNRKLFIVTEVITAERVEIGWFKEVPRIQGYKVFTNKMIGFKYEKLQMKKDGYFFTQEKSRKN